MKLSSAQRGEVAEAVLRAEFKKQGWEVAILDAHNPRYDMAIHRDKDEGWLKVQVKFAKVENGAVVVDLRRSKNQTYTEDEIDYFGVWCGELDRAWLIPIADVLNNTKLHLSASKFDKYILEANNVWQD